MYLSVLSHDCVPYFFSDVRWNSEAQDVNTDHPDYVSRNIHDVTTFMTYIKLRTTSFHILQNYFFQYERKFSLFNIIFSFLGDEVRQHRLRTAHVAAGVSVCILLVFVLILAIYVYIR